MGGMQMILVIGALTLLSILSLNSNRAQLLSEAQVSDAEFTVAATSVGQSALNDICSRAFDAATVASDTATLPRFTEPARFGANLNEAGTTDDVDDYHGFVTNITTPRAGAFRVSAIVWYVNPSTPDIQSLSKTHMKRIQITVVSDFMEEPVTLVYHKSY
ncbi:MAG: hypothetical protein HY962_11675 [Ignavibacteriae bacterium]|nr:hypothetical protein [Ignavibacteriota bacterium]